MRIAIWAGRMAFMAACFGPGIVSCGGGTPPPAEAPSSETTTTTTPPEGTAAPGAPAAAWKDMTKEQRAEHMKNVVMPKMKAEFAAADPERFPKINCITCHGNGVKDGTFKMPNPGLPPLSMANGFKKHMDESPEVTKFMMEKVVPDMAAMLGEQPYDPKTQQGFGCFDCHTMEK